MSGRLTMSSPRCAPTAHWIGSLISSSRCIRSTRRIPISCDRSSWSQRRWRRRWAGPRRQRPTWHWFEGAEWMSTETRDIIDLLAGIEPGSSLDAIRARRSQARENAQKSYLSLFEPADFGELAAADRCAVAAFVAGVHGESAMANFYL